MTTKLTVFLLVLVVTTPTRATSTGPGAGPGPGPGPGAGPDPGEGPATSGGGGRIKRYTTCPSGWVEFSGRCFLYVPNNMTWADAELNCQNYSGNLASVHSLTEHHVIKSLILRRTHSYPLTWIGGSDAEQEGIWFWSDGSPFDFTYWFPGEPSNYASTQHCLQINYGGDPNWDDEQCHYTRPSVCTRKA